LSSSAQFWWGERETWGSRKGNDCKFDEIRHFFFCCLTVCWECVLTLFRMFRKMNLWGRRLHFLRMRVNNQEQLSDWLRPFHACTVSGRCPLRCQNSFWPRDVWLTPELVRRLVYCTFCWDVESFGTYSASFSLAVIAAGFTINLVVTDFTRTGGTIMFGFSSFGLRTDFLPRPSSWVSPVST
jgi:hypothetical protein